MNDIIDIDLNFLGIVFFSRLRQRKSNRIQPKVYIKCNQSNSETKNKKIIRVQLMCQNKKQEEEEISTKLVVANEKMKTF